MSESSTAIPIFETTTVCREEVANKIFRRNLSKQFQKKQQKLKALCCLCL